jgi:hypothetical protein
VAINEKDLSHVFACLANLENLVTNTLHKQIPEQSAREFATTLKSNLIGQKFAGSYPPLKGWKKNEARADKFWIWYGNALNSINYHKVDADSWFAGFGRGGVSVGSKVGMKAKTISAKTKLAKKSSSVLRKAGQTTEQALAGRRSLIANRVKAMRAERPKTPGAYTPEHLRHLIGAKVGANFTTTAQGTGRIVSFGHEGKKVIRTQHN